MWISDYDFEELNIQKWREGPNKHKDNNQVEKKSFSWESFRGKDIFFKALF